MQKNKNEQVLTIAIKCSGVNELSLPYNTLLERAYIVSVSTRRAKPTRRTLNKKEIVNDNVYDASFLTLQNTDSKSIIKQLPLEAIDFDNTIKSGHLGYEVNIANIDMSNSTITVQTDESNIISEEHFELTFRYIPEGNY